MSSINVKIPDDMAEDLDELVAVSGRYMNQSEFVRDAIRHRMEEQSLRLSEATLRDIKISGRQFERGEYHTPEEVKERLGIDE